jgi:hypothetical protein
VKKPNEKKPKVLLSVIEILQDVRSKKATSKDNLRRLSNGRKRMLRLYPRRKRMIRAGLTTDVMRAAGLLTLTGLLTKLPVQQPMYQALP